MLEVYSADRATRIGYVANDRRPGVSPIGAHAARVQTKAGDFVCGNPVCTSRLIFVGPSDERRAHWRHSADDTLACSVASEREAEGAWHLRVKNEFFGPHAEFEKSISTYRGDARLDVYTENAGKRYAIEVQHSNISYEDAKERMLRHRDYGLDGTVWLLDAATSGIHPDDVDWLASNAKQYPGRRGNLKSQAGPKNGPPGQVHPGGVLIGAASPSSLIKLCAELSADGYCAAVLVVAEAPSGELVARRILEGYLADSAHSSGFVVRAFSKNLPTAQQFRTWSSGIKSGRGPAVGVRESRKAINQDVYFFAPDEIKIFGVSEPGGARHRGGFRSATKGFSCPCPECKERVLDGLKHLHVAGVVSEPNKPALAHLDSVFEDAWSVRRLKLDQRVRPSVTLPDSFLWDHSAVDVRYGYWLEELDSRLRSNGWTGHYDDYQDFIRNFEDWESFEVASEKKD